MRDISLRALFWTLDFIKGSPIKTAYHRIGRLRDHGSVNIAELHAVIKHAVETVPFYKNIKSSELQAFPLVNKQLYKENYELFRSSGFLNEKELTVAYTSGTSGTPFKALKDKRKVIHHTASLIDINKRLGWAVGDRFVFIRHWAGAHNKSQLDLFLKNIVPVDTLNLDDTALARARKLLREKKTPIILGYSSALGKLVDYLLNNGDNSTKFNIKLVVADTDSLSDNTRRKLSELFKCKVCDRYGNNENGIIAIKCDEQDGYVVNVQEYFVELLKLDSDEPASPGEMGRIVLTDLYNKAFPFIRYDTGDLGIAAEMQGTLVTRLKTLAGRSTDALKTTDGNSIFESDITAIFEDLVDITRYQVIQKNIKNYELLIQGKECNNKNDLVNRLKKCFGENAMLDIKFVNNIPVEKNGKYKTIRNEWESR